MRIIVLAKQVPDTRNVGKDAMKADGTINRAALPAIFNPEDLSALEQALRLKERYPGSTVTLLTMGPGRAAEIIREGLYRGADDGVLLTDRAFAGADTLATSYALAMAIRKIGDFDLIVGGRQAIDGDTAQVGPQVAEKLGLSQITYAEEIVGVTDGRITVRRKIPGGVETVEGPLPIVVTVNGSATACRPRNARLVQKYKHALGAQEKAERTKGKGKILVLEDVNEPSYKIDRMLNQLWQSGLLQDVEAIAYGNFINCPADPGDFTTEEILAYYAALAGKPAIKGLPVGHGTENATLPLGTKALLQSDKENVTLAFIEPALHT